jgi:hypothetical protein
MLPVWNRLKKRKFSDCSGISPLTSILFLEEEQDRHFPANAKQHLRVVPHPELLRHPPNGERNVYKTDCLWMSTN